MSLLMLGAINVLSLVIVLSSSNIFWIWIGLELNLYSTLPFLLYDKSRACLVYWIIKVTGSYFILIGGILKFYFFIYGGRFLKLRYFPLIYWLPSIVSSLGPWSLYLIFVKKKIPLFYIFFLIPLPRLQNFYFALLVFLCSRLALLVQTKVKLLLGWSSNLQTSLLLLLLDISLFGFVFFFILYSFIMLMFLFSWRKNLKILFLLVMLSGVPPFIGFLYKVKLLIMRGWYIGWLGLLVLRFGFVLSFIGYFRFFLGTLSSKLGLNPNSLFLSVGARRIAILLIIYY